MPRFVVALAAAAAGIALVSGTHGVSALNPQPEPPGRQALLTLHPYPEASGALAGTRQRRIGEPR